MVLARFWGVCRDELEADFQQYYGLNLEDIGGNLSVRHAALLAAHLPPESRCLSILNPDFGWSKEMHLMTKMEHEMRVLLWQQSQSKNNRTPFPKPIDPPSKVVRIQRQLEHTDIDEINERLGIGGETNGR